MATGPSRIPPVTVRWESAQPLLIARKTNLPKEMDGHYVISVSGLQLNSTQPRRADADPDENADSVIDRMKFSTTLQAKNKDPLQAGIAQRSPKSPALFFGFSRELLQITPSDRDVVFTTRMESVMVRAKFDARDMMFQGRLSI